MRKYLFLAAVLAAGPGAVHAQSTKELLIGTWDCVASESESIKGPSGLLEKSSKLRMIKTFGPKKVQTKAWYETTLKSPKLDDFAHITGVYSARWRVNKNGLVRENSARILKDRLPDEKLSRGLLRRVLRTDIAGIVTQLYFPATVRFETKDKTVWTNKSKKRRFTCKRLS